MVITHVLENDYKSKNTLKRKKCKTLDEFDERSEESSLVGYRENDFSSYLT